MIHQARSLGVLVLCFIYNMVFVNYTDDMKRTVFGESFIFISFGGLFVEPRGQNPASTISKGLPSFYVRHKE